MSKQASETGEQQRFHLQFSYTNPQRGHVNSGSTVVFAVSIDEAADRIMREREITRLDVSRRHHANGRVDEINHTFERTA